MATVGDAASLAYQARRVYTEELVKGLPTLINFVANWAASPERSTTTTTDAWQLQRIRDLVADMRQRGAAWHQGMVAALQDALHLGVAPSGSGSGNTKSGSKVKLSLVDDVTIEREITTSRLALAVMDRAGSEFNDLRARVALLERREELEANDLLRAHVLARIVVDAWAEAGLASSPSSQTTDVAMPSSRAVSSSGVGRATARSSAATSRTPGEARRGRERVQPPLGGAGGLGMGMGCGGRTAGPWLCGLGSDGCRI